MTSSHDVPEYFVIRMQFGWVVCSPIGLPGVPMSAIPECSVLVAKGGVIDPGIAHHLNECHRHDMVGTVVAVIAGAKDAESWRRAISEELSERTPQERWWYGTGVGRSSAAIFAALADDPYLKGRASRMAGDPAAVPCDSGDLLRCLALLDAIPEWKARMPEVAAAYPGTSWPAVVARWDDLSKSQGRTANAILEQIGKERTT